eukprot:251416_1
MSAEQFINQQQRITDLESSNINILQKYEDQQKQIQNLQNIIHLQTESINELRAELQKIKQSINAKPIINNTSRQVNPFVHIKYVDPAAKNIVFGYIRNEEIPNAVINIILFYYWTNFEFLAHNMNNKFDSWDSITLGDSLTIFGDNVSRGNHGLFPCVFGTKIIGSGITIWRIKIVAMHAVIIGIIDAKQVTKMSKFYTVIGESYSLSAVTGNAFNLKEKKAINYKYGLGDTICIYLDFVEKKLCYSINQNKFECIFENIDVSLGYRLAVCMANKNEILTLESSTHKD